MNRKCIRIKLTRALLSIVAYVSINIAAVAGGAGEAEAVGAWPAWSSAARDGI